MRKIILAGLVLGLAACGGNESQTNETNVLTTDNMMMDQNMAVDQNMMIDQNAMDNIAAAPDANTQNLMIQDATTNDADTNLANGL